MIGLAHPWVAWSATGMVRFAGMSRGEEVRRPFPDVSGHVEQPKAVRWEALDGRGALEPVEHQVLPGKLPLPGVGHHLASRGELVAPAEDFALQAASCAPLPLRLGRKLLSGPFGIRDGVLVGDVGDRVKHATVQGAVGALGLAPLRAGGPAPPVADVR